MGTGAGITLAASFVLVGEVSSVTLRGALGTLNASTRNLGVLYSFIVGASVSFNYHSYGEL